MNSWEDSADSFLSGSSEVHQQGKDQMMGYVAEHDGGESLDIGQEGTPASSLEPVQISPRNASYPVIVVIHDGSIFHFDCWCESCEKGDKNDDGVKGNGDNSHKWYFFKNAYIFLEDEEEIDADRSDCYCYSNPIAYILSFIPSYEYYSTYRPSSPSYKGIPKLS